MEANLFNMRFQASMGKLENTTLLQTTRRDIARAKTVLQQKSVAGK
jgi:large subunit ribosomal protein L29